MSKSRCAQRLPQSTPRNFSNLKQERHERKRESGIESNLCFFLALVAAAGRPALLNAQQSTAMLLHPTTGTPPSFDVATIKPNNDAGPGFRLQLSPTGLKATHASLRNLIEFAWSIKSDTQLIGAPAWSNSEFFDVQAKASEADIQSAKPLPMDAQMNNLRLKVQSLITDRFQLKAHFESRPNSPRLCPRRGQGRPQD